MSPITPPQNPWSNSSTVRLFYLFRPSLLPRCLDRKHARLCTEPCLQRQGFGTVKNRVRFALDPIVRCHEGCKFKANSRFPKFDLRPGFESGWHSFHSPTRHWAENKKLLKNIYHFEYGTLIQISIWRACQLGLLDLIRFGD